MATKNIQIGDKIKFKSEKRKYMVRAISDKFAICTKPFNVKKYSNIYTVIDWENKLRGRDNYHGWGYYTDEECKEAIEKWDKGEIEHSSRYLPMDLDIENIFKQKK